MNSDPTTKTTVDPRGCPQLDITRELCGAAAMRKDAGLTPTRATETTIYTTQVNMISVELGKSRGVRECSTVVQEIVSSSQVKYH